MSSLTWGTAAIAVALLFVVIGAEASLRAASSSKTAAVKSEKCIGEFQKCPDTGACTYLPSRCNCSMNEYVCPCKVNTCAKRWSECPCLNGTFWDWTLPLDKRLELLTNLATTQQQIDQLTNGAPAIDDLFIPGYQWLNDDLHGIRRKTGTSFPNGNGLGATWSPETIAAVGAAVGVEARALHHYFMNLGNRGLNLAQYNNGMGMTIYGPNINLVRDPRWGRSQEVYGEDPYLAATLSEAIVRGMQEEKEGYLPAAACCKHLAVYDVEDFPIDRYHYDAIVDGRNMWETYLPAFKACVAKAKAKHVMCSYNSINGVPTCAQPRLMNDLLRDKWNFTGFVVSDYDAWENIFVTHEYCHNFTCAAAVGINAGMDQEGGGTLAISALPNAIKEGKVNTSRVAQAFERLFRVRMELGMMDPPELSPFSNVSYSEIASAKHMELALQSAREAIGMYKNKNNTLPLRAPGPASKPLNIALIGSHAAKTAWLQGNYAKDPRWGVVSILEGLTNFNNPETVRCTFDRPGIDYHLANDTVSAAGSAEECGNICNANLGCNFFTYVDGKCFQMPDTINARDTQRSDIVSGARRGNCLMTTGVSYATLSDKSTPAQDKFECCQRCRADANCTRWTYVDSLGACVLNPSGTKPIKISLATSGVSPTKTPNVNFVPACPDSISCKDTSNFAEAAAAAKDADATVVVLGLDQNLESEGHDRHVIELPENQYKLVAQLRAAVAAGKPLVGVFVHGGTFAFQNMITDLDAVIDAWYPGEQGGNAIADVLFGAANPGSKATVTFYNSTADLPPNLAQQDLYPNKSAGYNGLTYRYYDGPAPVVPFGFGLSYTSFLISWRIAKPAVSPCDKIEVYVSVENTGNRAGDEVVQLYVSQPAASVPVPKLRLAAFKRIKDLQPGQAATATLVIDPEFHAIVANPTGSKYDPSYVYNAPQVVEKGDLGVFVGNSQPGPDATWTPVSVTATANLEDC